MNELEKRELNKLLKPLGLRMGWHSLSPTAPLSLLPYSRVKKYSCIKLSGNKEVIKIGLSEAIYRKRLGLFKSIKMFFIGR